MPQDISRHCKAIARCVRHQIFHNVELQRYGIVKLKNMDIDLWSYNWMNWFGQFMQLIYVNLQTCGLKYQQRNYKRNMGCYFEPTGKGCWQDAPLKGCCAVEYQAVSGRWSKEAMSKWAAWVHPQWRASQSLLCLISILLLGSIYFSGLISLCLVASTAFDWSVISSSWLKSRQHLWAGL